MSDVEKIRLAVEALERIKTLAADTSEDPGMGKLRIGFLAGQCLEAILAAPEAPKIKEQP